MLSKNFIRLVTAAGLITWRIANWIFIASAYRGCVIRHGNGGYQSVKAALANPANGLRSELASRERVAAAVRKKFTRVSE